MVNPLMELFNFFYGILEGLTHNIIGLGMVAIVFFVVYMMFFKKKPRNFAKEIFLKRWDIIARHMRFKKPMKLAICQSIGEGFNYQPIGNIIGFDVLGNVVDIEELNVMAKNPDEKTIREIVRKHEDDITNKRYWFALGLQDKGRIPFTGGKKNIILVRPYQFIGGLDSMDGVIRVRGVGLHPQGDGYLLVVDEKIRQTILENTANETTLTTNEALLWQYSTLGEIVERAVKSDSGYLKDMGRESIKERVLGVPDRGEEE